MYDGDMIEHHITQELEYDPDTGVIYRRSGPWIPTRRPTLNTPHPSGHLYGTFKRRTFKAHRVAWFLYHGSWPKGEVDHIDGNAQNNKLENLRDVTHKENTRNVKRRRDNTSGVTGVSYHKSIGRWVVRVGKTYVGCYKTQEEASSARRDAERAAGYHANHGR
jgi:hypothetical protein